MPELDAREIISDVQHDIWSHWMRWMFTVGTFNDDGTWTMPATKVVRWQGQMEAPYSYLTEGEKDSDREQTDKVLAALELHNLTIDLIEKETEL